MRGWLSERFELCRGGSGENMLPMEGLRGVAVALVFGVHFGTLSAPWQRAGIDSAFWSTLHSVGNAGVDLFFVLSGYLIYGHLMRRPPPFLAYIGRRAQRIYPAFLAVFVVYVALAVAIPGTGKLPADDSLWLYLAANLLLLPGLFPMDPLITVAWSLSYEMFFYIVMPLLIVAMGLRRASRPGRAARLVALTVVALLAFGIAGGPVRLCMFLFGALLVELPATWRAPGSTTGVIAGMVAIAAMGVPAPGSEAQALRTLVLGVGFVVLCRACLAGGGPALARAMSWWPLRWLGNMSYSYYLLHGLALHAFFATLARVDPTHGMHAAFMVVPAFAVTLLPSAVLFIVVERPFSLAVRSGAATPAAGCGS